MENPARARALDLHREALDLQARGEMRAARECCRQALQDLPDHPALLQDYAQLCVRTGEWQTATTLLERLAVLRPDAPLDGALGLSLARQGRDEEAITHLRRHLARTPADEKAWLELAQCLVHREAWTAALRCAAEAERIASSERALDLALECLGALGLVDEVEACVADALARYPDSVAIRAHQGVHLLRQGRIREGLRLQPMIRRRFSPQRHDDKAIAASRWDGAPFDGILLVSSEQGIGEEILASSFFRYLIANGQRAVIECDPRLFPVFRRSFPALTFVAPAPDNHARLSAGGTVVRRIKTLDLAPLLIRDEDFAQPARWLVPDSERVATIRRHYRERWPGRFLVGFSWRSVRQRVGHEWKSIPLESLQPVLALPGIVAIDVQYGSTAAEREIPVAFGLPPLVRDETVDPFADLDGLLAQLCALDAVVTVSNTTAHIAGAAGVPAQLILPEKPPVYVYWGYAGERTPMYPSLRLWRPANFTGIDALATALAGHLAAVMAGRTTP